MTEPATLPALSIHPLLLDRVIQGTHTGLMMTGIQPEAVGASKFPNSGHNLSVIVGLMGDHAGSITLNLSQRAALVFTGAMLAEEKLEFDEETLDAIGEIGNMIAGAVKESLADTDLSFSSISCPTIVMGQSYDFHLASGYTTVGVTFELSEIPVVHMKDRLFSVSISIMKA